MDAQSDLMRDFIFLAEEYVTASTLAVDEHEPEVTGGEAASPSQALIDELMDAISRLRSHMEPPEDGQELALGVEMGMQRAADLIESVIRRFDGGENTHHG